MNRPVPLHRDELVAHLQTIIDGVRSGDSLEGSIEFLQPYPPEPLDADFMVRASYRIGNLDGQGSVRLVGDLSPETVPADLFDEV